MLSVLKSCAMSSVLGVFDNNKDNWNTQEKINAKLISDVLGDEENCPTGNGKKHHTPGNVCVAVGPVIYLNQTSGHPTLTSEGHYTATSLTLQFLMKNFDVVKDGEKEDKRGDAFEEKVLEIIRDVEVNYASTVSVEYAVTRSFGDEFGAATRDITKLQIAFILILGYATLMLSKGGEGCVGSRVFVSGMGVVSIGLAIASSYGLCSYFGLFYSPLMNVLPFLLLGIGVDDMFVLVNAYDNTNPYLSIAERLGNAMSTAGMSITVTSFTDIFAFLIGSTTSLPALRNFCFYALWYFLRLFVPVDVFRSVLSHRRTPPNAKERGLLLLPNLRRRRDVLRSVLQASGGGTGRRRRQRRATGTSWARTHDEKSHGRPRRLSREEKRQSSRARRICRHRRWWYSRRL